MSENRLLIVDDDADFASFVGRVAEQSGYDVVAANNPDAFRGQLASWQPDVIVLDLRMPGTDGVELLRELARDLVKAKIFLASGVDERVLDTARQLGTAAGLTIAGTLLKPVRAAELRRHLESVKESDTPIDPADIARAIERQELALHYQPRLDAASGRVSGVEALIRWWHPTKGLLMPGQFLSVIENSIAIDRLTDWVVAAAVRQVGLWRREGVEIGMSVNVSARNLGDLSLPDRIAGLCQAHGVPHETLTVELTETATMQDANRIMDILARMRLKGFGLAIDDFGTGYSSLVQLRRLPFTEIKIDKSFVGEMLESKDSSVIVRTIIDMARNLGLVPVAEGVESERAARKLVEHGCHDLQGYWISRPLPADDLRAFFEGYGPVPWMASAGRSPEAATSPSD